MSGTEDDDLARLVTMGVARGMLRRAVWDGTVVDRAATKEQAPVGLSEGQNGSMMELLVMVRGGSQSAVIAALRRAGELADIELESEPDVEVEWTVTEVKKR